MRGKVKNRTLALLAASSALALSGALVLYGTNALTANADEGAPEYLAFVNAGANADAALIDEALGLSEKGGGTVTGTATAGSTLFESFVTDGSYSVSLDAGTYRVAVAILAETGTAVTVGGEDAEIPAGTTGKHVVSVPATVEAGTPLTVEVTGKLCGVLVTNENGKVLMTADYTAGQVIPYGALLADVLEGATGYYSDGTTEELAVEYENIIASGGVNVNFTTVNVSGLVEGTSLRATRYVTTMPDDLVYFINCGSFTVDGKYEGTSDKFHGYNRTLFDYYGQEQLKNYGMPDRAGVSKGGDEWGCYTSSTYTAPGDATFPYNTLRWTEDATDMGYMLTDLTPNADYRIWIGTLSAWHARTVSITFNDKVVGADTLRINASKGFTIYENVPADANGKIDLHMQGASTNEPCINFIAVQAAETEVAVAPSKPQGSSTIGLEDTSLALTGVTEGAKIQMYNAARPNQLLFEEMVNAEELGSNGEYVLDWGEPVTEAAQFNVVLITGGGVSAPLLVSITDIEGFSITASPEAYTVGSVTVTVKAHADSGIASWSYRLGEYGAMNLFEIDRPYELNESFTVSENGDYIVVVTSGLGVTYSETVRIGNIDPDRPVIAFTPSKEGWKEGSYNVTLNVTSIAPVTGYTLYKNGAQLASSQSAPSAIAFTEEGEYLVMVKTAAGQSATAAVNVSAKPTTATVVKSFANRTLKYTFADTQNYKVASVSAYEVKDSGVTRMTIASGNVLDVFNAGTYVVTVTTENGAVEMFSLNVTADDLKNKPAGLGNGVTIGVGVGVGVGGAVIAAAAVVATFLLLKKKRAPESKPEESSESENRE